MLKGGEFIKCLHKDMEDVRHALMYDLIMDEINEAKKEKERKRKHLYNLRRKFLKERKR